MGLREIFGKFFLDTSDAENKVANIEKRKDDVNEEIDKSRIQLAAVWSYGNQLMNLMLQQASKMAEGTKSQAIVQKLLSLAQIAQQEVAIGTTETQAIAALIEKKYFQFAALQTVVIMMQSGLFAAEIAKRKTEIALDASNSLITQIKTYSGGL